MISEFWLLVNEAHDAGKAVDNFDLHSEDPASVAAFGKLVVEQAIAAGALIAYIRKTTNPRG